MKKILAIVLSLMLLVVFAIGCKKADTPKAPEAPKAPAAAPATADKAAADKAAADKAAPATADKADKKDDKLKGLFTH